MADTYHSSKVGLPSYNNCSNIDDSFNPRENCCATLYDKMTYCCSFSLTKTQKKNLLVVFYSLIIFVRYDNFRHSISKRSNEYSEYYRKSSQC